MKLWLGNGEGMVATVVAVLVFAGAGMALAQADAKAPAGLKECPEIPLNELPTKTFGLRYATQQSDGNEVLTGLRIMMDPAVKMYLVPDQYAIVVRGCPHELELAGKLIADWDKPKKNFRLTYTVTETEGGKRIGLQHVAMVVENAQRMVLKNGSRVPIVTGTLGQAGTSEQQMTYLDIGLSFDATATASSGEEITLKTKVEQSSVAEEKSGVGPQDPVVRQSVLEGSTILTPGKAQVLGSFDVTGSTRHIEIEVVAEAVK